MLNSVITWKNSKNILIISRFVITYLWIYQDLSTPHLFYSCRTHQVPPQTTRVHNFTFRSKFRTQVHAASPSRWTQCTTSECDECGPCNRCWTYRYYIRRTYIISAEPIFVDHVWMMNVQQPIHFHWHNTPKSFPRFNPYSSISFNIFQQTYFQNFVLELFVKIHFSKIIFAYFVGEKVRPNNRLKWWNITWRIWTIEWLVKPWVGRQ